MQFWKMIPETTIKLAGELWAEEGASSLPLTSDLTNSDNFLISTYFLYLLHDGKCPDRTMVKRMTTGNGRDKCVSTCMFAKSPFLDCIRHLDICPGANCPNSHCKQGTTLYNHWMTCDRLVCHICSSAVALIGEGFCSFLQTRGNNYAKFIETFHTGTLAVRKSLLASNIQAD